MAKKKTDPVLDLGGKHPRDIFPNFMDTPPMSKPEYVRWEYLRVEPEGQSLVDTMNVYGAQGWEAVSVDAFHGVAYMKRWAS